MCARFSILPKILPKDGKNWGLLPRKYEIAYNEVCMLSFENRSKLRTGEAIKRDNETGGNECQFYKKIRS